MKASDYPAEIFYERRVGVFGTTNRNRLALEIVVIFPVNIPEEAKKKPSKSFRKIRTTSSLPIHPHDAFVRRDTNRRLQETARSQPKGAGEATDINRVSESAEADQQQVFPRSKDQSRSRFNRERRVG